MATKAVNGKVNDNQERFCQLYAITLNVGKAATDNGFTREYGYQLLKKEHIRERIDEIQRTTGVQMIVTKAKVIRETAYLAYSDVTEVMMCRTPEDFAALPENVRKAIKEVKVTRRPVRVEVQDPDDPDLSQSETVYQETYEIKMHSKTECLRLLGLMSGAIEPDEDQKKADRPAFTGLTVISGGKDKKPDNPQLPHFVDDKPKAAVKKKRVAKKTAKKTAKKKAGGKS